VVSKGYGFLLYRGRVNIYVDILGLVLAMCEDWFLFQSMRCFTGQGWKRIEILPV
jgi:hypothetical protein